MSAMYKSDEVSSVRGAIEHMFDVTTFAVTARRVAGDGRDADLTFGLVSSVVAYSTSGEYADVALSRFVKSIEPAPGYPRPAVKIELYGVVYRMKRGPRRIVFLEQGDSVDEVVSKMKEDA